ncbi:hypothetical protein HDU96_008767 [Phlyctochytrium bullatum]|nr:hypothetical protein HDU96_008767 [Phlyctochytrium bullatum]
MAPPFEGTASIVSAVDTSSVSSADLKKAAAGHPKSTSAMAALLSGLSKDIHAIKKHGNPLFSDVQSLADRTWKATITVEAYIEKLNKEKEMLNQAIDTIWSDFDVLIRPLWRIDDSIVPVYDQLATLRLQLENLQVIQKMAKTPYSEEQQDPAQGSFSAEERETDLHTIQERLHAIENDHVVDGKFVPKGWKAGDRVPGGQALVANLLARCYKLVRHLQESEPTVSPRLYPLENRLLNIVSTLTAFKQALIAGALIDPIELRLLQEHVREIDSKRKDGKFIDEGSDDIPEGQAILTGLLEEAYDLIHDCLLEIDSQRGSDPVDDIDALLERVAEVRSIVSGYVTRKPEEAEAHSVAKAAEPTSEPRPTSMSLLGSSSAALSALRDTLGEGYTYVRGTAGKLEEGIASTVSRSTSRLVSAVRSGLSGISTLLGSVDPVDPTLENVHQRLVNLKASLLKLRNEKNEATAKGFAASAAGAAVGVGGGRLESSSDPMTRVSIRTHVAELDQIDALRDEDTGDFLNEEGVAARGQQVLKSLYEECYLICYDLIR